MTIQNGEQNASTRAEASGQYSQGAEFPDSTIISRRPKVAETRRFARRRGHRRPMQHNHASSLILSIQDRLVVRERTLTYILYSLEP